jgi:hypothetical protein
MAVSLVGKVWFVVILAMIVFGVTVAGESDGQQGASQQARKNFLRSITVMSEAIEACERKEAIIDIPHWRQLGTDRESLLLGIKYYYLKRDNECLAQAAKNLLMAVKILEISSLPDWEKQPAVGFVDMVLDSRWKELEAEFKYRSMVSRANQEKIDSISGLKQPFKLLQSWDVSGN